MQLQPRRQPGRADRKAAAYASEIVRLRAAGYTFEAIREALADIGLELTTSALRREVHRLQQSAKDGNSRTTPASAMRSEAERGLPPASLPQRLPSPPTTKGQQLAEAFFNANPSNPLLRSKETP